jgi:predicted dehydrogenase
MKLAILGPGRIADGVAHTLVAMPEIECYAVASRTPGKAEAFAEKFGFRKAYTGYEEMLSDPEV